MLKTIDWQWHLYHWGQDDFRAKHLMYKRSNFVLPCEFVWILLPQKREPCHAFVLGWMVLKSSHTHWAFFKKEEERGCWPTETPETEIDFVKGIYIWKSEIVGKLCWSCWFLGFVISIHKIFAWVSKYCFTSLKHNLIVSRYRNYNPGIVN